MTDGPQPTRGGARGAASSETAASAAAAEGRLPPAAPVGPAPTPPREVNVAGGQQPSVEANLGRIAQDEQVLDWQENKERSRSEARGTDLKLLLAYAAAGGLGIALLVLLYRYVIAP